MTLLAREASQDEPVHRANIPWRATLAGVALILSCSLCACGRDPAPTDLDALTKWFWLNESDDSADMSTAVVNLHAQIGTVGLLSGEQDTLSPLQKGDVDVVGFVGRDPSAARGMMLMNAIPCTLDKLEQLFIQLDQKALHTSYTAYSRTYTTDVDAYLARTKLHLGWESVYTVSGAGSGYTAKIRADTRFVPAWTTGAAPHGPAIVSIATLEAPATTVLSSDYFRQDYQIQVFYERAPGEVVHLFAVWREQKYDGFSSDGDILVSITLDNLADADKDYANNCK